MWESIRTTQNPKSQNYEPQESLKGALMRSLKGTLKEPLNPKPYRSLKGARKEPLNP